MPDDRSPAVGRERARELLDLGAHRELTDAEQQELTRLLHEHPGVEYDQFAPELAALGGLGPILDEPAPPALRERIAATAEPSAVAARPRRWSRPLLAAAAVALLGLGAAGSAVVGNLLDDDASTGPPGTLGAVEQISFDGEPSGVAVDASVVAHTWGTETLVDVDGLPAGETFTVVVIAANGDEFPSGEFIGSTVPVTCAMNAAVLRQEAASIEIRDAGGGTVMKSELPPATA
ncbi:hypothetical protein [Jiangella alkaliphila]|uniref:Anti-sigma-K factor rskA n=1 Tax=Jiangella alkaliphila TaxID=419479 RepID=A0A1H2L6V0_9ACTN|nr:hypothetical protein [Jiangella alkaliphila]SDU76770.1 hypothetical protein SAMN04488563_5310 [Jiangella alkaliphila]